MRLNVCNVHSHEKNGLVLTIKCIKQNKKNYTRFTCNAIAPTRFPLGSAKISFGVRRSLRCHVLSSKFPRISICFWVGGSNADFAKSSASRFLGRDSVGITSWIPVKFDWKEKKWSKQYSKMYSAIVFYFNLFYVQ